MCFRFWLGSCQAGLYGLYISTGGCMIKAGAAAGAASAAQAAAEAGAAAGEATLAEATIAATE